MEIKEFVEKAIEGGYNLRERLGVPKGLGSYPSLEIIAEKIHIYQILLDPKAWEAVGKVEGWNGCPNFFANWSDHGVGQCNCKSYEGKMHAMIDALTEDKSIEEYIKTL